MKDSYHVTIFARWVCVYLHYRRPNGLFYFMKFLENDLEEIIYTSGRDVLEERGLPIYGTLKRQLKIGNYGIADLVEFNRPFYYETPVGKLLQKGTIKIYELKKEQVGIAAFLQSLYYLKGIQSYLYQRGILDNYVIDIVLIGRNIDKSGSFCFIPELINLNNPNEEHGEIMLYTYKYEIDGLRFVHEHGYHIKSEGF